MGKGRAHEGAPRAVTVCYCHPKWDASTAPRFFDLTFIKVTLSRWVNMEAAPEPVRCCRNAANLLKRSSQDGLSSSGAARNACAMDKFWKEQQQNLDLFMKLTVRIMRGSKPKVLATGKFLPHKREFCAHHTRKKYVSITSSSEEVRGYGYRGDR